MVGVNTFVKRQVEGSGKTYAQTLTFDEIAKHAEYQMIKEKYSEGYRDGVRIVHADQSIIKDFICPYVKLNKNTKLISKLTRRREKEEFYIQTRALNGDRVVTGNVDLILYRKDVLEENDERSTNHEWELISFNAIPIGIEYLPMGVVTMMRNQLNLIGGTRARYSTEEWAYSVDFWQKYAPLEPDI